MKTVHEKSGYPKKLSSRFPVPALQDCLFRQERHRIYRRNVRKGGEMLAVPFLNPIYLLCTQVKRKV
jgi:hypothetical protein